MTTAPLSLSIRPPPAVGPSSGNEILHLLQFYQPLDSPSVKMRKMLMPYCARGVCLCDGICLANDQSADRVNIASATRWSFRADDTGRRVAAVTVIKGHFYHRCWSNVLEGAMANYNSRAPGVWIPFRCRLGFFTSLHFFLLSKGHRRVISNRRKKKTKKHQQQQQYKFLLFLVFFSLKYSQVSTVILPSRDTKQTRKTLTKSTQTKINQKALPRSVYNVNRAKGQEDSSAWLHFFVIVVIMWPLGIPFQGCFLYLACKCDPLNRYHNLCRDFSW